MDFGLSEDQQLLKSTIARYLTERCPTERVREIMDGETGHDEALWADLAGLGVFALAVPTEYGGLGSELLDVALVAEELGRAATPGPFLGVAMATVALAGADAPDVHSGWLERIATGEAVVTTGLGEEQSRWDPSSLQASVEDDRLTGCKAMVPYASVADAIVVAARDADGPALWLVERGAAGMGISALKGNDLTRRLDRVTLENVQARRLGGSALVERVLDAGLVLLAADAFGGAEKCLRMTRDYSLQREQFGQPIGAFQSYKHQLADMATEIEPSMSLYWYAAHAFDRIPEQASRHAALAKAHLGELFNEVAFRCTELHGGIGFTWEYDLQLWFRRALFDKAYLGEAALHRERAARMASW